MLINLSNHPSSLWSPKQLDCAKTLFGEIADIPFPALDPKGDEQYVSALAEKYHETVISYAKNGIVVVHIMGEMTFCFALITMLQRDGIRCVASTSERLVEFMADGTKKVTFEFERFRSY